MVVLLSVNSEGSSDLQGSGREQKILSLTELSESQRQPNLLIAGEGPAINNQPVAFRRNKSLAETFEGSRKAGERKNNVPESNFF